MGQKENTFSELVELDDIDVSEDPVRPELDLVHLFRIISDDVDEER